MSIFSGRHGKGAMGRHRKNKREQAEARNAFAGARTHADCGHVHGVTGKCEATS